MSEVNPPSPQPEWVKIGLRADEPAHCALFKHFLNEGSYPYTEAPEYIAVLREDVEELSAAVEAWAFTTSMPDDERTPESLNSLLREIGKIVLAALDTTGTVSSGAVNGIDLR